METWAKFCFSWVYTFCHV